MKELVCAFVLLCKFSSLREREREEERERKGKERREDKRAG
jgi:hypothetical protein